MLVALEQLHCDFIKITDFSRKCFRHICLVSFNAIINNQVLSKENETSIKSNTHAASTLIRVVTQSVLA